MRIILLAFILFFNSCSHLLHCQTILLKITNISEQKGQLCIAFFDSEEGFKAEKTCYELKIDKSKVKLHELQVEIPFRSGKFGISVLDDANFDGKMQYNLICIPREGFGFSDYYHRGIKRPVFDDFDFYLEKNEVRNVTVRMKYF